LQRTRRKQRAAERERFSRTWTMHIRRAIPEDAGAIAAIHVASSHAAYEGLLPEEFLRAFTLERRQATWHQILTTRDGDVWIAQEGDSDVGWICVGPSRDADSEPTTAELRAMYIDPQAWRQGIGRALWAHAELFLRAAHYSRVTLWVFEENARAASFYRSVGFVRDPGHTITRARGGVEAVEVRLQRDLGG